MLLYRTLNPKKCLDIQDVTASQGSAAIINTSDLDDSQRWHLELLRDGGYYITSVKDRQAIPDRPEYTYA